MIPTIKISTGLELPVLAIGTHSMGGPDYGPPDPSRDNYYIASIQEAVKLGYTHIDTAEIYGGGHTEEIVGKAITLFDRSKLIITTKVSKEHLRYNDVISAAKASLKRLGTDYIDLYLIHRPNPDVPIKETMAALDFLVEKQLVRYVGVSAFNVKQMKEAQSHAKNILVANQLKFNLWKKTDLETIKYCQENGVFVIAYKPFGRGAIKLDKISLITELAKKYKKTEAQIILNWMISKKNFVTLFKSTDVTHLKENKNVFDFSLTSEETRFLDNLIKTLNKN